MEEISNKGGYIMKIIMLAGQIGSGKSYIMSQMLQKRKENGNSVAAISFADPIKKFVIDTFGYNKNGVEVAAVDINIATFDLDKLVKRFLLYFCDSLQHANKLITALEPIRDEIEGAIDTLYDERTDTHQKRQAIRYLMQIIGTDLAHKIKRSFWIKLATEKIKQIAEFLDYIIIDDWRFLIEFKLIRLKFQNQYEVIPHYVFARPNIRAERRGIPVEQLLEECQHVSELESSKVILPFMDIHYKDNIIVNEE